MWEPRRRVSASLFALCVVVVGFTYMYANDGFEVVTAPVARPTRHLVKRSKKTVSCSTQSLITNKPAWLFVPCQVDGFWSNMKQVGYYLYTAIKSSDAISFVPPDLFYTSQPDGNQRRGPPAGPVPFDLLFDINHINSFVSVVTSACFFNESKCSSFTANTAHPLKNNHAERDDIVYVRPELETKGDNLWKSGSHSLGYRCDRPDGFKDWQKNLGLMDWNKVNFTNRTIDVVDDVELVHARLRQLSQQMSKRPSTCPDKKIGQRFVCYGLGNQPYMTATRGIFDKRSLDMFSIFMHRNVSKGMDNDYARVVGKALKFSPLIRQAKEAIAKMWGMDVGATATDFAAVHVRLGNTFPSRLAFPGGISTQVTVNEVVSALSTVTQRSGCNLTIPSTSSSSSSATLGSTSKIVVSMVSAETKDGWVRNLRDRLPHVTVHTFDEATWKRLDEAGLAGWPLPSDLAQNTQIVRDLIEMQFWQDAKVFIGTRSTMSEFMFLMRHEKQQHQCTISSQPCIALKNYSKAHPTVC